MAATTARISRCQDTVIIPRYQERAHMGRNRLSVVVGLKADTNKTFGSIGALTFSEVSMTFDQLEVSL